MMGAQMGTGAGAGEVARIGGTVVPIGTGGVGEGQIPPVPVTDGVDTDGAGTDGAGADVADTTAAAAELDPPACGCTAGLE